MNVELALPVYLPTLSDRVYLEILDNSGDVLLAVYHLSFAKIRNEGLEPSWLNCYGPRPQPPQLDVSKLIKLGPAPDAASGATATAYRGRMLVQAHVDDAVKPVASKVPIQLSRQQQQELEPKTREHVLQCELFEGYGFPAGGNVYLLLAWGSTERKSPSVPVLVGVLFGGSGQFWLQPLTMFWGGQAMFAALEGRPDQVVDALVWSVATGAPVLALLAYGVKRRLVWVSPSAGAERRTVPR